MHTSDIQLPGAGRRRGRCSKVAALPDDKHAADEFCEEILGSVQGELEDLLNDELKTTVENGFAQLEKLILQSNNPTPDSLVRKVEKFPKPAPKKVRRNS